jgi:hypothetical protein
MDSDLSVTVLAEPMDMLTSGVLQQILTWPKSRRILIYIAVTEQQAQGCACAHLMAVLPCASSAQLPD